MIQGWRPPGASTAIRPSRVVGWPAPIATLVVLFIHSPRPSILERDSPPSFDYSIRRKEHAVNGFPKGKIVVQTFSRLAGVPEPGTGQSAYHAGPCLE